MKPIMAVLGLIALLLGGCAHPPVASTASVLQGVESLGIVKVRDGLEKQSLRVAVMARPGEVRIESRSPLGSPLFVLRLRGGSADAWSAERGAIDPLELAQALGWPRLPNGRDLARMILSPEQTGMQWDGAVMTVDARDGQGLPASLAWQGDGWQGLGHFRSWSKLEEGEAIWAMPGETP